MGSPHPATIFPWETSQIPVAQMFVFMLMTLQCIPPVPRHRPGSTRKQMVCSHGEAWRGLFTGMWALLGKAGRISTVGSQSHPRTGGAEEGRGEEFSGATKLASTGAVWPNRQWGWCTDTPVHSSPTTKGPRSQAHQKGRAESQVSISNQTRKGWSRVTILIVPVALPCWRYNLCLHLTVTVRHVPP